MFLSIDFDIDSITQSIKDFFADVVSFFEMISDYLADILGILDDGEGDSSAL